MAAQRQPEVELQALDVAIASAAEETPEIYKTVRARVAQNWGLLQKSVWSPLLAKAGRDVSRNVVVPRGDNWRAALQAAVLECAVRWAMDGKARARSVRDAATQATALDGQIIRAAKHLAGLICERRQIERDHGLRTEWGGPNLELWDLIERSSHSYPDWALVSRTAFLRVAAEQTRPGPELEDVLMSVETVHPGIITASHSGDAATVDLPRRSAHGGVAERTRRFLEALSRQSIALRNGDEIGALQWMGPTAIATLLTVVATVDAGLMPGEFNADKTRKTLSAFLKKRKSART